MSGLSPTLARVEEARTFLSSRLPRTPLVCASSLRKPGAASVYLKLEAALPTGSFKVRGALFALHFALASGISEVVTASTGNHGAAVAFAARELGVRATIFVPCGINEIKRKRIEELRGLLVERGEDISEARHLSAEYAAKTGAFELDDATNPHVPFATGTIACEIMEELPETSAIWVPMGDTGLIRGVAAAAKYLRPDVKIIGVQAQRAPSYYLSWLRGSAVTTAKCETIADGLATRIPAEDNVCAIRQLVDDIRLVEDEQMMRAIRHLWIRERIQAEPSGAATTGAWLADSSFNVNGPVVLLMTGNNISGSLREQLLTDEVQA